MADSLLDRAVAAVPPRLAWPLSAAAVLLAVTGSALVLVAASFGSITAVVGAVAAFVVSGGLWHAADAAQTATGPDV